MDGPGSKNGYLEGDPLRDNENIEIGDFLFGIDAIKKGKIENPHNGIKRAFGEIVTSDQILEFPQCDDSNGKHKYTYEFKWKKFGKVRNPVGVLISADLNCTEGDEDVTEVFWYEVNDDGDDLASDNSEDLFHGGMRELFSVFSIDQSKTTLVVTIGLVAVIILTLWVYFDFGFVE